MRTTLVTVSVLGVILMGGTSATSNRASAQSRGHADFQGYWLGVDPVDGGDARRSLVLRSDGKYALAARDSMLTLCDSTDRGFASFDDGTVVSRTVMQSNTLVIKCFNNGATVQLHLRFELVEHGLMIETATLPDGSPVSTIVLHKVSTELEPEPGVRSQKLRTQCIQSSTVSPAGAIFSNSPQRRPASPPSAASTSLPARSMAPVRAARAGGCAPRSRTSACRSPGARKGKRPPSTWGRLLDVDVTWFDAELSATKQLALVEEIASEKWDFVAIQAVDIDTITAPVVRMIEAGIPVIDMDTLIAPLDQIDVLTFLAPDNEFMGAAVTQALVDAIGGQGTIIMTQGALGHTGALGRANGFQSVIDRFPGVEVLATDPADWDVAKTAQLWETYLETFPKIDAAFFHNDDMALAAANVMKAHGRTQILIGGVDAMPPAIAAVVEGRMFATVRNSSSRIHGGAIVAGVTAARGRDTGLPIPKRIVIDGPIVTRTNAAGMLWMEEQFLI